MRFEIYSEIGIIPNMPRLLSIREAANELGLSARRVRALVEAERLPAARIGDRYVIDGSDLARLKRLPALPGRPMSAHNAWGLLALLSGHEAPWLGASAAWRLKKLIDEGPDRVEQALLRAELRADVYELRMSAADLPKLKREFRLVPTGLAVRRSGLGVLVGLPDDGIDAYVDSVELGRIRRRFRPHKESGRPNALLRVPENDWILDFPAAPPAVVAADLLEHHDLRVARAASDLVAHIVDANRNP